MPSSREGILFCDVCGESVPARDLASGAARRHGKRVLCSFHVGALASPASPLSTRRRVAFVVLPLWVLGLTVVVVVLASRMPGTADLERLSSRLGAENEALAERLASAEERRAAEAAAAAEARRAADARAAAAESGLAALKARADGLADRLSDLDASIAAVSATSESAAAALRAGFEPLREDVEALGDEMTREREARARAATPPAPTKEPEPAESGREVAALRRQLVSIDAAERFSALVEIAKLRGRDAVADVAVALSDADPFIRSYAARLLGDFRLRSSVPDLLVALRDADVEVRRSGHASLRSIAGSDFGYDPEAEAEGRSVAIRRVEEWWRADAGSR